MLNDLWIWRKSKRSMDINKKKPNNTVNILELKQNTINKGKISFYFWISYFLYSDFGFLFGLNKWKRQWTERETVGLMTSKRYSACQGATECTKKSIQTIFQESIPFNRPYQWIVCSIYAFPIVKISINFVSGSLFHFNTHSTFDTDLAAFQIQ